MVRYVILSGLGHHYTNLPHRRSDHNTELVNFSNLLPQIHYSRSNVEDKYTKASLLQSYFRLYPPINL